MNFRHSPPVFWQKRDSIGDGLTDMCKLPTYVDKKKKNSSVVLTLSLVSGLRII